MAANKGRWAVIAVIGVIVLAGIVAFGLLWRTGPSSVLRFDAAAMLERQAEDFPAPAPLTLVGETARGRGAPFFGERPTRTRVYESSHDVAATCTLLADTLSTWGVQAGPVQRPQEPSRRTPRCALVGSKPVEGGSDVTVLATVYDPEQYRNLIGVSSAAVEHDPPPGTSMVLLELSA